jgi:DctM-like transporters.
MSDIQIAFTAIVILLLLLAVRVPIGVALGSVSIIGIAIVKSPRTALGSLGSMPYDFAAHWTLSAVPMFLLMGAIAYHSGLTHTLYRGARLWLSFLPGGWLWLQTLHPPDLRPHQAPAWQLQRLWGGWLFLKC